MMLRTGDHPHVRRATLAALLTAALLSMSTMCGAQANEPHTFQGCYKGVRSCQKSRCRKVDGEPQVTCMRQCSRDYDSCVSSASSGSAGNFPQKQGTTGKAPKQTHPNMHRGQP